MEKNRKVFLNNSHSCQEITLSLRTRDTWNSNGRSETSLPHPPPSCTVFPFILPNSLSIYSPHESFWGSWTVVQCPQRTILKLIRNLGPKYQTVPYVMWYLKFYVLSTKEKNIFLLEKMIMLLYFAIHSRHEGCSQLMCDETMYKFTKLSEAKHYGGIEWNMFKGKI